MTYEQGEAVLARLTELNVMLDKVNTACIASVEASRWLFLAVLVVAFATLFQALKR